MHEQIESLESGPEKRKELIERLRARVEYLAGDYSRAQSVRDFSADPPNFEFQSGEVAFTLAYSHNPIWNERLLSPGQLAGIDITYGQDRDYDTEAYQFWADGVVTKNLDSETSSNRMKFLANDDEIKFLLGQLEKVEPSDASGDL